MRFSEGGGCFSTPTPCAYNPEPLWGHERVRGKEDGCADEVRGWGAACVQPQLLSQSLVLLFSKAAAPELHRFLSTNHKKSWRKRRDSSFCLHPFSSRPDIVFWKALLEGCIYFSQEWQVELLWKILDLTILWRVHIGDGNEEDMWRVKVFTANVCRPVCRPSQLLYIWFEYQLIQTTSLCSKYPLTSSLKGESSLNN